jgi:hypothetical protein
MAISDLTKEQFEQYAKESTSWKELMTKCGYTNYGCRTYLKKKLDLYEISISHFIKTTEFKKYTDEELFIENSTYTTTVGIKKRLVKYHNWKLECSNCKLSEWMEQPIPIEVDHINGNHTDNRIDNLRFLCPNCHALTDTYKGKNIKNKEHSKEKLIKLKEKKICKNCNNKKHKNSEYCLTCHTDIKLHTQDKIIKKCKDCDKEIQKECERCWSCDKKAKKEGIFEKEHTNTTNMKKCADCDNFISKKSLRCRLCHYALMKSKSETESKEHTKGQCIDCNTEIVARAVRCVPCSDKIIENANKKIKNKCIDCETDIDNKATRCTTCYQINSRKVERPPYEQLIKDKETLSMVQIGKKYCVSDNTIRKWIKRYEKMFEYISK